MSLKLCFPSASKIKECLEDSDVLKLSFYQQFDRAKNIIAVTSKRFANRQLSERGLDNAIDILVVDLQMGKDGYTGEKVPQVALPEVFSVLFTFKANLKDYLLKCATAIKV
jgi:hypothetical protein